MKRKRIQSMFFQGQKALFEELRDRYGMYYKDLAGVDMSPATANRIFNGWAVNAFHMLLALMEVRDWLRLSGHGDDFGPLVLDYLDDVLDELRRHG